MATMATYYKCTRADGTDFRTGTVKYDVGAVLELNRAACQRDAGACGYGLHLAPTAKGTCRFGDRNIDRGAWRWWECEVDEADIIGRDDSKIRTCKVRVVRELTVVDVFGASLAEQIAKCRAETATWKNIPWCKPSKVLTPEDLAPHLAKWHEALEFWRAKCGRKSAPPRRARIITDGPGAISAAKRAAGYWSAVAAAGGAAADDAAAAADDAAAAAAAADDAAAAAADAAAADAAAAAAAADDAAAADADAAAAAADDAAAADADDAAAADAAAAAAAAAAAFRSWRDYGYWYLRPYYVLWRAARWQLGGLTEPDPFAPLVALYRMGALPLGYVEENGEVALAIYCPPPAQAAKEAA